MSVTFADPCPPEDQEVQRVEQLLEDLSSEQAAALIHHIAVAVARKDPEAFQSFLESVKISVSLAGDPEYRERRTAAVKADRTGRAGQDVGSLLERLRERFHR